MESGVGAEDLVVGDEFKTIDGKTARIINIIDVESMVPFLVYNIEDLFFHNYVVDLGLIVHNSAAEGIVQPKIITNNMVGTNLRTGEKVTSILYDSVSEDNAVQIFTKDMGFIDSELSGSKAVIYIDNEGKLKSSFFTESDNTHHVQVGAKMAELDSGAWSEDILKSYYDADFSSPQTHDLLRRQFGFDFLYDKNTRKIIQIRMNSGITGAQRDLAIASNLNKFPENVIDDVIEKLFDNIDPRLLDDKYKDFAWLGNPELVEQLKPRDLIQSN